MRTKVIFLIIGTLCLTCSSGCWDLEEVDQRSFVTALGIDIAPGGQVILTAHLPLLKEIMPAGAEGSSSGRSNFHTISGQSSSVYGAFNVLRAKTNRHLVIQQNKLIIIGEPAARQGVKSLLDWLIRTPKAPPQELIFIAHGRSAAEVLTAQPTDANMPGLDFIATKATSKKESTIYLVPIWRFREIMINRNEDLYAPLLGFDPSEGQYLKNGLGVFNGDRLAGELSPEETQAFGILTNQMRGGNITYRRGSGEQGAQFSLRNISTVTRIKVSLDHDRPNFLIETKISGVLTELLGKNHRLTPGFIDQLEREIEAETGASLNALIGKMQQIKSDAIGFGLKLRAQHYTFWKEHDWKMLFPTSRFQVAVKAHLMRDGVIR